MKIAKPIGNTPILQGKEEPNFLNRMIEPLNENDKKFKKEHNVARNVSF